MKTISIKLLLVILIFNFSSCKNGNSSFSNYQFADKDQVISCTNTNSKLLNEALYSFEKDIVSFYDKQKNNPNIAYNTFTKQAVRKSPDFTKFTSKHSVEIATALQNNGLIKENGLDYKNPLFKCIAKNMKKEDLKTTFNALVTTNSLSKEILKPALQNKTHRVAGDKYLALYVALEYYYAELLKVDFSTVDFNRPETAKTETQKPTFNTNTNKNNNGKVDFNRIPRK